MSIYKKKNWETIFIHWQRFNFKGYFPAGGPIVFPEIKMNAELVLSINDFKNNPDLLKP